MSLATLAPADDFERFEFEALVADLETQPLGEPLPDPEPARVPRQRPARGVERQQAIAESLGIRRHRSREREA
jgi:hypothetical protein